MSTASNRRLERGHRLASHCPKRLDMAGECERYNPHTHKVLASEICSARKIKLSIRPSSLRLDLICFSDKMQKIFAVPHSNSLARVSTRQSCIVAEDHMGNIVKAPLAKSLAATKFLLPLLLLSKWRYIMTDALPKVENKEPEVEDFSNKQARSSSTAHSVASVSQ